MKHHFLLFVCLLVSALFSGLCQGGELHDAAKKGDLDRAKELLAQGADVNETDGQKLTALHYAARNGDLQMLKFLVENGANINAQEVHDNTDEIAYPFDDGRKHISPLDVRKLRWIYGDTVLHSAVRNGNLDVVKYLVEKGADVNKKTSNGENVLNIAAKSGNQEMVQFLVEKGAK